MSQMQVTLEAADQAKVLLEAWNCGDIDGFQHYLETGPSLKDASSVPVLEYERRELLDSIMQNLRSATREKSLTRAACELQVSIQLLRHLVSTH